MRQRIARLIKTILPYLGAIILTALVLGAFYIFYRTLTYIGEVAPEAISLVIGAGGAILILVLLFLMGVRAPPPKEEEVKR